MNAGKILLLIGSVLVAPGVIIIFFGDKPSWFGRLPGDIRMEIRNSI